MELPQPASPEASPDQQIAAKRKRQELRKGGDRHRKRKGKIAPPEAKRKSSRHDKSSHRPKSHSGRYKRGSRKGSWIKCQNKAAPVSQGLAEPDLHARHLLVSPLPTCPTTRTPNIASLERCRETPRGAMSLKNSHEGVQESSGEESKSPAVSSTWDNRSNVLMGKESRNPKAKIP